MADRSSSKSKQRPILALFSKMGFLLAVLAVFVAISAGFGTRWGLWNFRTGFIYLKWGAFGAIAALLLSVVGLFGSRTSFRNTVNAFLGTLLSLGLLVTILGWMWTARTVPPIHDITTDTDNPPKFVAVLKAREGAANPAEYGGAEIAAQQKSGYPDLGPLILAVAPDEAFKKVLETAQEMGWFIVDTNPVEGRIEATDTTLWFGFKDDIVIRILPSGQGSPPASRIDVRSVSRVGRSDVGTNAKRIKKFLKKLSA